MGLTMGLLWDLHKTFCSYNALFKLITINFSHIQKLYSFTLEDFERREMMKRMFRENNNSKLLI